MRIVTGLPKNLFFKVGTGLLPVLFLGLSACSALPYKSEFNCPKKLNGKCVSVETAYREATGEIKQEGDPSGGPDVKASGAYQEAVMRRLTELLTKEVTPMVDPPDVMRITIFRYSDDQNDLYMPREIFTFVDDPKWVLGENASTRKE
ncbi:MAG: TraV family lipoprotein [Candidatus Manganitrophaceae bacterium]